MHYSKVLRSNHPCEMPRPVEELDQMYSGITWFDRAKKYFRASCLVNTKHPLTVQVLNSRVAIQQEKWRHLHGHSWIIHPFSCMRLVWEMYMTAIFLLSLIFLPWEIAFDQLPTDPLQNSFVDVIYLFLDLACLTNIAVNFFTGYHDVIDNKIELSAGRIAKRYLRRFFIIDLISSLPIDIMMKSIFMAMQRQEDNSTIQYYLIVLTLLRFLRVIPLWKYMTNVLQLLQNYPVTVKLIPTIGSTLLILHCLCCINYLVPTLVQGNPAGLNVDPTSWIRVSGAGNDSKSEYSRSYLRTVGLTTRTFHGWMSWTVEDMILSLIIAMSGFVMFIYNVGNFLQIMYIRGESPLKFEEDQNNLIEYMQRERLPKAFQRKMLALNDFKYQRCYFKEKEIERSLTGQLKMDVMTHNCQHMLDNVHLFRTMPMSLKMRISKSLHSEVFIENQMVVEVGTVANCMYFIYSGTLGVYNRRGKEVAHLADGNHFGEIALISASKIRNASVIALEMSEVYRLDEYDFRKIIAPFPDLMVEIRLLAKERSEQLQRRDRVETFT